MAGASYRKRLRELHEVLTENEVSRSTTPSTDIFVVQKGSITKKMVDIWLDKLPTIDKHLKLVFEMTHSTKYIILSDDCNLEKLYKWGINITADHGSEIYFLKSDWIVEFIRTRQKPDVRRHLHPLMSLVTTTASSCAASCASFSNEAEERASLFDSPVVKRVRPSLICPERNVDDTPCDKTMHTTDCASVISFPPSIEAPHHQESSCLIQQAPAMTLGSTALSGRRGRIVQMSSREDEGKDSEERDMPLHFLDTGTSFACQSTGTQVATMAISAAGANKHITDLLDQLQEVYELEGDQWRANGYKRASATLQRMGRVTDSAQLKSVRGFGKSIREKIQEIITTGTLLKLQNFKSNTAVQLRMEFTKIWGVGPATAHQLVTKGYSSIEDIRQRGVHDLNEQQKIGLNRFEDLQMRIPREEVESIESFVLAHLNRIDPGAHGITCGSYRRGKSSSGDVDILIYPKDGRATVGNLLPQLIKSLSECGFLTDHLSISTDHLKEDEGFATYMGVCRLLDQPGRIHRRLDLKGLFRCGRDSKRVKVWKGSEIPCLTEREVFDVLKIEYKLPHERNCFDTDGVLGVDDNVGSKNDTDDSLWASAT